MTRNSFRAFAPFLPDVGVDFKKMRGTEREVHPLITDRMRDAGWRVVVVTVSVGGDA